MPICAFLVAFSSLWSAVQWFVYAKGKTDAIKQTENLCVLRGAEGKLPFHVYIVDILYQMMYNLDKIRSLPPEQEHQDRCQCTEQTTCKKQLSSGMT